MREYFINLEEMTMMRFYAMIYFIFLNY